MNRQTDGSKTETTLSSVDTRGSWPTTKVTDSILNSKSILNNKKKTPAEEAEAEGDTTSDQSIKSDE